MGNMNYKTLYQVCLIIGLKNHEQKDSKHIQNYGFLQMEGMEDTVGCVVGTVHCQTYSHFLSLPHQENSSAAGNSNVSS